MLIMAGSIPSDWAFANGRGGSWSVLAARRLCVTAQLRGSAFDAFNIRTSELFFILRWKVRVSQPGQIAQGEFHFPFVGPPAFICRGCTSPLPHGEKKAGRTQVGTTSLGPGQGAADHLGAAGTLQIRESFAAYLKCPLLHVSFQQPEGLALGNLLL